MKATFTVTGANALELDAKAREIVNAFWPQHAHGTFTIEASPLVLPYESEIPAVWEGEVEAESEWNSE